MAANQLAASAILSAASADGSADGSAIAVGPLSGQGTVAIAVQGSLSATLRFEGTIDGSTWFALGVTPVAGGTAVTSTTSAGNWFAPAAGLIAVRVRCSAHSSGTPTVILRAGGAAIPSSVSGNTFTVGTVAIDQSVPATTNAVQPVDDAGIAAPVASKLTNLAAQAVTASTPVDLWTPATGKKWRLLSAALSLTVAGSVILKNKHSGVYTEVLRTPLLAAGTGIMLSGLGRALLSANANDVLAIDVTASGSVSGFLAGREE